MSSFALLIQAQLAGAAPDLIEMAKTEDNFTLDLLSALNHLPREELNGARDGDGRSMLHVLATRSHQARALPVLLAGGDVDATDHLGRTPMFDVMEAGDPAFKGGADVMFLEMLTVRGADVNARANDGSTPLVIAVTRGDYAKAEFRIRRGAVPNPEGVPPEKSPLIMAEKKEDKRMIAMLEEAIKARPADGVKPPISPLPDADQIAKALTAADLKAIHAFVESGWDINERDDKGRHLCCEPSRHAGLSWWTCCSNTVRTSMNNTRAQAGTSCTAWRVGGARKATRQSRRNTLRTC